MGEAVPTTSADTLEVPGHARYVVVGAGVHGLSTAWHLARALRRRGGSGADVLVVDKSGVGAGASGIACGIVRNNYFQPAMRRLMAHSVSVWESDPQAFSYHPVGYLQAAPDAMRAGVEQISLEQQEIGYPSTLVEGAERCARYLQDLFGDWKATGVTTVLHEHRGGYANNAASMRGLAGKARSEGVRILTGVRVVGLDLEADAVTAVVTDHGTIACDELVVAAGPWIRDLWAMLGLPATITVRSPDGRQTDGVEMWTYLLLQEGALDVDPAGFVDRRGRPAPVVHVDSDAPLYDEDGELVTADMWGVYYKADHHVRGVQGGTVPAPVDEPAEKVAVDPYGPESTAYTMPPGFARMWTAALAHCHGRFENTAHLYRQARSGGLGCFTPDSFPVFDRFRHNAYVIADSNHGYKMIGVGALVAEELLGRPQDLLEPFRFDRYRRGALHPTSKSPFPWS